MKRRADVPAEKARSTLGRNVNIYDIVGSRRRRGNPTASTSTGGRLNTHQQRAWEMVADQEGQSIRDCVCSRFIQTIPVFQFYIPALSTSSQKVLHEIQHPQGPPVIVGDDDEVNWEDFQDSNTPMDSEITLTGRAMKLKSYGSCRECAYRSNNDMLNLC